MRNIVAKVDKAWLEIYIPAGAQIVESARELAQLSYDWDQPLCAELNGYWLHVTPKTQPDEAAMEVAAMLSQRSPA